MDENCFRMLGGHCCTFFDVDCAQLPRDIFDAPQACAANNLHAFVGADISFLCGEAISINRIFGCAANGFDKTEARKAAPLVN